uniref:Uncharacterized protein n=1 Tax=viral metagenome TaxID=1070528 RepID=A0A6C0BLA5_9ZZZZ
MDDSLMYEISKQRVDRLIHSCAYSANVTNMIQ